MKDVIHHLRYVQKKVIQANRREENAKRQINGTESVEILGSNGSTRNTHQSKKPTGS